MIGVLGFDSRWRLGIFLFTTESRTALGHTQPPIQWVTGALSLGVKRPGREADHSPLSSDEVKNAWRYTSTSQYAFMAWCLFKRRDKFTFTFTFALVYTRLSALIKIQWSIICLLWQDGNGCDSLSFYSESTRCDRSHFAGTNSVS
jgi:hypothetical protein